MTQASSKQFISPQLYLAGFFFLILLLPGCTSSTRQGSTPTTLESVTIANSTPTDDEVVRRVQPAAKAPTDTLSSTSVAVDTASKPPSRGFITYTIQPGDTLFGIAGAFGLRPETVLWCNYSVFEDNPDLFSVGMELVIPPSDGLITTVTEGDSIDALARQFQVAPEDIVNESSNKLTNVNQVLVAGQKLFIPGGQRETVVWQMPKPVEVRPVSTAPTNGANVNGYSLSVTAVQDPCKPDTLYAAKSNTRIVGIEIVLSTTPGSQWLQVSYRNAFLIDTKGFSHPAVVNGLGCEAGLDEMSIRGGSKVRGVVSFEIPNDVRPAVLDYNLNDGERYLWVVLDTATK